MPTLIAALLFAVQVTEPEDVTRLNRLMTMERNARNAARYAEAERLGREAESIARRLPNPDSPLILVRNELAIVLSWQGRFADVIKLLEEALPVAMKLSTREHLVTAVHLGFAYRAMGRLHEAELVVRQALRAHGAGELPEALSARSQLAGIEALLGRGKAARALYWEVLTEQTRRLGPTNRETLTTLASLVEFTISWKRYDEAEKLALRYLEDNAKAEAAGHPSNASGHYNLAILDLKRKRYPEASARLHRALEIFEASGGRRNPNVAAVLDALASIEVKARHLGAALELSREAVSISEETLGPRHRDTGVLLHNYAAILHRAGFRQEARQSRERALAIVNDPNRAGRAGLSIDQRTLRLENRR